MTITAHACITIACDVCKYVFDEDEYTAHFTDLAEARKTIEDTGWTITADSKIFCGADDTEHQAALDALMPPEPVTQIPGQLGLDGTEATR
ncbi:hypothetical protein F3K34_13275 [Streptomyces sp. LBUM 1486]|uniref:hypothetical protein n=1 Tax=Streptomyces scabiei TaxID=1930 RepID=UPI001B335A1A|nr:hypothetical protein [Streptomyces sp. LBUM 1486]MBP5913205.1 hypothetical protein [Streptomyces sp. LBUM 1486]